MAEDDDVIFIDLQARLDEDSADRSLDNLKSKTQSASKTIGESLKNAATPMFDALEKGAENWASNMASTISRGGIGAALDEMGKQTQGVTGIVADLGKAFGADLEGVRNFGKESSDWLGGVNKSVESLSDVFKGRLPQSIREAIAPSNDLDKSLKDVAGLVDPLGKLPGKFGEIGGAIGKVIGPAATLVGLFEAMDKFGDKLPHWFDGLANVPNSIGGWLHDHLHLPTLPQDPRIRDFHGQGGRSGSGSGPAGPNPFGGAGTGIADKDLHPFGGTGTGDSSAAGAGGGGAHQSFGSAGITASDYTRPSLPDTISGPEDIPAAGARVRNVYALAQAMQGTPYSMPLRNDCSGAASRLASVAAGLGDQSAGQRFTTVNEGQRLAQMGFQPGLGGPNDFNVGWYDHGGGENGHTAVTLPGGVNAESGGSHGAFALGGPAVGASSPQFTQHAHLSMGGGSGAGVRSAGFGAPGIGGALGGGGGGIAGALGGALGGPGFGVGSQPNMPSGAGADGGHGGGGPISQHQLGSGKGFGLTGQGLLGLAAQAPGIAASAAGGAGGGFGGGAAGAAASAIWSNLIQPQINLAAQKGGQIAAAGAAAPFETFGLSGGQMGAESVDVMGGWGGKLIGGLLGSQFSMPNLAGAQQKPAEPKEGQGGQQGQGGGGGGKGGGKDAGSSDPKTLGGGTHGMSPDNPLHVSISGGGGSPNPAQGGATSAMSTVSPSMAVMTA
jgi:hypothetical protein